MNIYKLMLCHMFGRKDFGKQQSLLLVVLIYFSIFKFCKGIVPLEYSIPLSGSSENAVTLPELKSFKHVGEKQTKFSGKYHGELYTSYGVKAKDDNSIDLSTQLSWETVWTNGKRRTTYVRVNDFGPTKPRYSQAQDKKRLFQNYILKNRLKTSRRIRRNIYQRDDRMYVPTELSGIREPFISTVKISTGCTGVVISPRHVLTAAHCLHDQQDYIEGIKNLKVGFVGPNGGVSWISVKTLRISKGWIEGGNSSSPHYDYALLRLKRRHNRPYFRLSISKEVLHGNGERIYFSSYEEDKPQNTLWYRSCSIKEEDQHFLYHYCDARPGSSGAGVYAWDFNKIKDNWDRRLIGVFSGNRWLMHNWLSRPKSFNVAVRITPCKYVQICKWMGKIGDQLCDHIHDKGFHVHGHRAT